MPHRVFRIFACAVLVAFGRVAQLPADQPVSTATPAVTAPVIKRTILNRIDVPGSSYEVVYALVEIAPNSTVARHTHPGTVFGYLLEGDYTLVAAGQPPHSLAIGDTLEVPAGIVHEEHSGNHGAKLLVVFTVEKGKPLSSPAPLASAPNQ